MLRVALIGESMPNSFAALAGCELSDRVSVDHIASTWSDLTPSKQQACDGVVASGGSLSTVEQALAANKHVLLLDPVVCVAKLQNLNTASTTAKLIVCRTMRSMAYQLAVRESLDAGHLGSPGLLRLHHWHSRGTMPEDCASMSTNELDLACWLFGGAPEIVFASANGAGVLIHLGFHDGGMAMLDCHAVLPPGATPYYSLTLIGTNGAAYADDHHNTNLLLGDMTLGMRSEQGAPSGELLMHWFANQLDSENDLSLAEAIRVANLVEAVSLAIETGKVARLVGDQYELQ